MPYDAAPPPPSPVDFKEVLAHLASGVAIVSCWDGETPRGLLVSSITGLSVEPPRFLFCVRKEASCHDALLSRSQLAVALLGSADHDEALRFASSSRAAERFVPELWVRHAAAPVYRGGLASAVCQIDQVVDAGTHSIFIITASEVAFAPGPALVAWNRSLSVISQPKDAKLPRSDLARHMKAKTASSRIVRNSNEAQAVTRAATRAFAADEGPLARRVAGAIEQHIEAANLGAGHRLRQQGLATSLHIPRSQVVRGLEQLVQLGRVAKLPRRGFVVLAKRNT